MQTHADALILQLDGATSAQSTLAEKESEQVRRALKADLMKVDATMALRWGFEFRLLDAISEAWNLSGLERKAKESEAAIAQLDAELEAKKEAERFKEQTLQTHKLGLYVATFALVQVPSTVLQISDRWVGKDTQESEIIAITAGTVAAGIWLLMWFTHRKLKRLAAEAG
jgi:murein tripeptide amidase MpaA